HVWARPAARSIADLDAGRLAHAVGSETGEPHRLPPDTQAFRIAGGDVDVVQIRSRLWAIEAEMRAAALVALERAARAEPGGRGLILEVEPVLPREIVGRSAWDGRPHRTLADLLDLAERHLEARGLPHETHLLPHDIAQMLLQRVEILALASIERLGDAGRRRLHHLGGHPRQGPSHHPLRHDVARDPAEHSGIGHAIAPEPVRAVDAARVLARGEESLEGGPAGCVDDDAAHHEVCGRAHLDGLARQVATE